MMGILAPSALLAWPASFLLPGHAVVTLGRVPREPVAKIVQQASMTTTALQRRHVKTAKLDSFSRRLRTLPVLIVKPVSIRTQRASSRALHAAVADTELQLQLRWQARA